MSHIATIIFLIYTTIISLVGYFLTVPMLLVIKLQIRFKDGCKRQSSNSKRLYAFVQKIHI